MFKKEEYIISTSNLLLNKHTTYENRKTIEESLNNNLNFSQIGLAVNKPYKTISNEIKMNKISEYGGAVAWCKQSPCERINKPPYVCNGCSKRKRCSRKKYYYYADDAQISYKSRKSNSRIDIRISQKEIYEINNIITPLIKDKHQSINHVFINHPDLLYFSKPTFYSYVNNNLFSFRNIDLTRKVTYKPRKDSNKTRTRTESLIRIGRTYKDFLDYLTLHPYASVVEMDTVEGIKGGNVFLTLLFRNYNFMLIFLMKSKTMECVEKVFINIRKAIGNEDFKKLFEVILTDNGSEFFNPISIEADYQTGEVLVNVFYCDPSTSYQKGSIEKNHEYIRYVIPKGNSFNHLTQEDCNLLASHINSTCRIILNNKTPFEAISTLMNKEIISKFNIDFIEADEVNLSPNLLKRRKQ